MIVGGPTLNDDYPAVFGIFAEPGPQCAALNLAQPLDQAIRVSSVVASRPWQLSSDATYCGMGEFNEAPYCHGYVFPAGSAGACKLAVRLPESADGQDWFGGGLTLTYEARCTSLVGSICSTLAGKASPTSIAPVIAFGHRIFALKACLHTVPIGNADGPDGGELYLMTDEKCRLPIPTPTPSGQ